MEKPIVTVVGASGTLGTEIARALLDRGVTVRAMVRATSDRSKLESIGVTDFVVGDLNDRTSLEHAMAAEPRAAAVISSAAGFTAHAAKTKGNNPNADIQGYRDLVDAAKAAGIPRFVLISILGCDRAPGVPHFHQKFDTETYLVERGQPYLALRAGAFLDRARDIVPERIAKGVFPDILPGVPMALIWSRDLARYAAQAALDVPAEAMNGHVDIGCDVPATGEMVAASFARVLGRPIVAKPVFPRWLFTALPLFAWTMPRLRANLAVLRWLRKGGYVSDDVGRQRDLFGDLPTIEQTVERYVRDKRLS